MPHAQHEQHLRLLQNIGTNVDEVKKLVRNPKFICKGCGRVAAASKAVEFRLVKSRRWPGGFL